MTSTDTASLTRKDYTRGRRFRVVKEGARLVGMTPIPGGQQGWGNALPVGTVLTCQGSSMSFGDGVPLIKWTDEHGAWIANDCEFQPSVGGMWNSLPHPDFIEPLDA